MGDLLLDSMPETAARLPLVLRLLGEQSDALPLDGDKLTIGSGQSCTIRLAEPGVRPLACLITCGDDGPRVRRWADGTLLNGEPFTDASLTAGDRLAVGPVEFEVAELAAEVEPEPVIDTPEAAGQPQDLVDAAALASTRQRARQLLRTAKEERQRRFSLAEEVKRLEARLAEVEQERGKLTRERDELASQLSALAADLSAARGDLEAFRESQAAQEQEISDRLAELERQVAERTQLVLDLQTELEARHYEADDDTTDATDQAAHSEPGVSYDREPIEAAADEKPSDADAVAAEPPRLEAPEKEDTRPDAFDWVSDPTASEPSSESEPESEPSDGPVDERADQSTEVSPVVESDDLWNRPVDQVPTPEQADWTAGSMASATAVDETLEAQPAMEAPTSTAEENLWGEGPTGGEPDNAVALPAEESLWHTPSGEPDASDEPVAEESAEEEDLWGTPTTEPPTVAAPRTASSTASEREGDVWDVERAAPAATAVPPTEIPQEPIEDAAPATEEDVWGRLSSLRAAASEKLHSEVEPTPSAAWDSAAETPAADDTPVDDAAPIAEEPPIVSNADEGTSKEQFGDPELQAIAASAIAEPTHEAESPEQGESELVLNGSLGGGPTTLFDAPADEEAPAAVPHEPVSFVEKYKHLLEDDGEAPSASPAASPMSVEPLAAVEPTPAASPAASATSDDDESIEEYMAAMMARLRGASAAPQPTPTESSPTASKPAAPQPPAEPEKAIFTPAPADNVAVTPRERLTDLELIKSGGKPEPSTDLTQLRDLANSTAREAIHVAHSRRTREKATTTMAFCAVAGWSGAYLVWASAGALNTQLFAGTAAVAASAYWASRSLRRVTEAEKPQRKPQPPAADSSSL